MLQMERSNGRPSLRGGIGDTDYIREYTRFQPSEDEDSEEGILLLGGGGSIPRTVAQSWKKAMARVFKRSHDLEGARVNHQFSSEERVKLSNVDSIDYLAPNSAMYRKWLAKQPHRRQWDRWVLMGLIGSTTGLVAHMLYVMINLLAHFKYGVTRWLIARVNMGVAWLFNIIVTTGMVALSSVAVVGGAPEAVGSGIPEVMAYLNGCMVHKVFNIFTLVVKFVSCGLAVGAGLPVGPEGPLIHIGAALGSAISQGHSTTLGFTTGLFKRFRNPKDKRDFVTAGVSALLVAVFTWVAAIKVQAGMKEVKQVGVATAFNAPIGGLLFAFEEVASFWQHSLGWQVFFACTCATLALNLSKSAAAAMTGKGHFGWFDKEVAFEAGLSFSSHVLAVFPAFIIGVTAGLFAIVFTYLNLKIARLRDALMSHMKWRRIIEPCVLAALYTTGCMVLPLFFACTPTNCIMDTSGDMLCETGLSGGALSNATNIPDTSQSLPLYTCTVDQNPGYANGTAWIPQPGSIMPDERGIYNSTYAVSYNELATLLLNTGEESIKHLFARGTHKRFGYSALAALGIFYFLGAAVFAGSAISSGLFVPMMMVGAVIGRFMGLATVDIAQAAGKHWSPDIVGQWTWIDPGAFALVGAGAFMGGVTRLTMALAVIMIEISSDVHMLLPVLVAILTAKWVADAVTHSLYHGLLAVKCVPFLPHEPISKYPLDLIPVSFVMKSPVVTLRQKMKVREITEALRGVSHNGFPVVKDTPQGQVAVGLITRSHLMALLQRIVVEGRADGLEVTWDELNRRMMDPVQAQRSVHEQQMVALQREMANSMTLAGVPGRGRRGGSGNGAGLGSPRETSNSGAVEIDDLSVDLMPYTNTSALVVLDSFSVERTYILFRTMGLRHLIVIDMHNHVRGIVTRKDLLGYKLDEALQKAMSSQGPILTRQLPGHARPPAAAVIDINDTHA